jgi:hypothetical protein
MMKLAYDAIWGFEEDISELRKDFKERIIKAHTSQPIGIPLHRYRGQLILDEDSILLSEKNKGTRESFRMVIARHQIIGVFLGWDDVLRRWRDTRAWIRPLRLTFENQGEPKTLYVYVKRHGRRPYGNENKELFEILSSRCERTVSDC